MAREMKDSGIEWIGSIPSDWNLKRLCYLIEGYKAGPFGSSLIMDKLLDEGEILVYTPENISENNTELPSNKYLPIERKNEMQQFIIHSGDIIFPIVGTLGRAMYITDDMPTGIINQRLSKFHICSSEIDINYFLRLFAKSSFYLTYIDLTCRGSIIVNLTKAILHDMPVLLPPITEQKRIADYLDKKCVEIDSLSSDIQSQISILEDYKKSTITEAVTKGLNPDVEMKDSGIEWIGEIPSDWRITHFKYVGVIKSNLVNVGLYQHYPQISPDNIAKDSGILLGYNTVEESGVISDNHLFYKGQILYSKIRPQLNKATIAPFDGLCSADMYPIETREYPKFVLYMILSQYFLMQVSLVTKDRVKMPKINQEELGRINVVLPEIEIQEEIAKYLDSKCSEMDGVIEDKRKQLEILEQYKKSLIYEYVTGKKEV